MSKTALAQVNAIIALSLLTTATPAVSGLWHFDCSYQDAHGSYDGAPEGPVGFSGAIIKTGTCSLDLTGEGARVIFSPGLLSIDVATIEGWVYPVSGEVDPTTGNSGIFWDKSTILGVGNGGFRVTFNHPLEFVRVEVDYNPGSGGEVKFPCPIPLNQWTHIAVAWDGSTIWVYKNCGLVGQAPLASHPFGPARVSFGAAQDGGDDFDGYMDEVRLTPGVVLPTESGCAPVPVEETSWGRIKQLYE